ncbi:hypothetical protein I3760_07G222100 [Carya illinoinensis]|nr:putative UPF0481 protein At3g02645 [Carya illinoinensis]KAG2700230.1 hypothetical protein I3760_07G222100 [Carya illinoinensis]
MSSEPKAMEPTKLTRDQEWVIQISRALEEGLEDNDEAVPLAIFNVPKTLMSIKPEAYTPQLVALGPYHHRRLELLEMEHYKLASAKRVQNNIKQIKFRELANSFAERDGIIRSCYLRFLNFDRETLAWMFAIDASFLLECLHIYSPKKGGSLLQTSSKMGHLINHSRKRTAHHAILRDIIMLENQIPLFLLKEVHGFYQHEDHLASTLLGFCEYLSPISFSGQNFREECFERAHLLDLLYYMVTPELHLVADCAKEKKEDFPENIRWFKKVLKSILAAVFYINSASLHLVKKICKSKSIKVLLALPFTILCCILSRGKKGDINSLISSAGSMADEVESASHEMKGESPLAEEIAIPSVSELYNIGVKFRTAKGGLEKINFDNSSGTFYLPVIHLDDNSEVVLRNLVAYEACIAPEVMVVTRYAELMNGIVDTKEDVKILREAGIIVNRLKSDAEVTTLCNGITKSVSLTKVPILDKAIEGANTYYSRSWKVRMNVTMKKYVFASWPFLTFLAANILILLSIMETACSMYNCSKLLTL